MFDDPSRPGLPPRSTAPGRASRRSGSERRSTPRTRSLLAGKIIISNGEMNADCIIRDLSPNGARVRLSRAIGLPHAVMLLVIRDGLLIDATVSWRIGEDVGLALGNRRDLRRDQDPAQRSLRMLWASVAPH
jgi:hypothetical protein